jgi:hypothetical protein
MVSKITLINLFKEALTDFFKNEKELILSGISERSLCSRLAYYLQLLLIKYNLQDYYADSEYNRKQDGRVKTLLDDEMMVVSITCDVIVHSRGKKIKQDNLIAVEMKKSSRPQSEKNSDKDRLRALTKDSYDGVWNFDGSAHPEHACGYILGYYMEIDQARQKCLIETYIQGEKKRTWEEKF